MYKDFPGFSKYPLSLGSPKWNIDAFSFHAFLHINYTIGLVARYSTIDFIRSLETFRVRTWMLILILSHGGPGFSFGFVDKILIGLTAQLIVLYLL